MEKEYIYKIVLNDDTVIEFQKEYNFSIEKEMNDDRYDFIEIQGNIFNKEYIKYIIIEKNENYVKDNKEEN